MKSLKLTDGWAFVNKIEFRIQSDVPRIDSLTNKLNEFNEYRFDIKKVHAHKIVSTLSIKNMENGLFFSL